jgi:hypothetical protein
MSVPALFGVSGPDVEAIEIGWEDNGYVTGAIGVVLLLIGLLRRAPGRQPYSMAAALLAGVALLEVAGCFLRVLEINPEAGFFPATKVGIYVSLLGALLALAGGLSRTPLKASQGDAPSGGDSSQIQPVSI